MMEFVGGGVSAPDKTGEAEQAELRRQPHGGGPVVVEASLDRKSTRLNSSHT